MCMGTAKGLHCMKLVKTTAVAVTGPIFEQIYQLIQFSFALVCTHVWFHAVVE